MSVNNLTQKMKEARTWTVKTATAALTSPEIRFGFVKAVHALTAIVLTLPPASASFEGADLLIASGGAASVKVYVLAGFGGTTSKDTFTLAQGDMVHCFCDGAYWYGTNVTTGAAT